MKGHKIDPGEAIAIVGSVFRLLGVVKARVVAAKADGVVTPAERLAIARAVFREAEDGLLEQVVTALED